MRNKIFLFTVSLFILTVANAQNIGGSFGSSFTNFNTYSNNTALNGSNVNFNAIENTKGRRYLFDGWAKGNVITSKGDVINNDTMLFNLDKMNNTLLVTEDKNNIIAVNRADISSMTLSDGKETYHFERVDAINPQGFLQVLAKKENGYILYKSIRTKFEKADYHTDGLMESGKSYDEYSDEYKYFIVMPDGKSFKEVALKSKSIKEAVGTDPKAAQFFSAHKNDPVNETYLSALVDYLNQ
jgi:hypothetical protein